MSKIAPKEFPHNAERRGHSCLTEFEGHYTQGKTVFQSIGNAQLNAQTGKLSVVGASVPRVDGVAKVTGKARYAGDLVVPGALEGKFLRSPYAHARIRAIDTRAAESLPGVVAVFTSKDLTEIDPFIGRGKYKDQPIIALDRVIYAGQPVAAVAARDRATAEARASKLLGWTTSCVWPIGEKPSFW